jgi:hypothetical protein
LRERVAFVFLRKECPVGDFCGALHVTSDEVTVDFFRGIAVAGLAT